VSKILKFTKIFDNIDFEAEIAKKQVILPQSTKQKTLVLDLDETLIHSDFLLNSSNHDAFLEVGLEEQTLKIPLILRPNLFKFLDFCSENYELILFTASKKEYANCIINYIEKDKKYFKHKLYRDSCINILNKFFFKDLRILQNRNLKDMILLDNSLISFSNQLNNGVLITSFYCDPNDNELENLMKYLELIAPAKDVRVSNKEIFNFERIKFII